MAAVHSTITSCSLFENALIYYDPPLLWKITAVTYVMFTDICFLHYITAIYYTLLCIPQESSSHCKHCICIIPHENVCDWLTITSVFPHSYKHMRMQQTADNCSPCFIFLFKAKILHTWELFAIFICFCPLFKGFPLLSLITLLGPAWSSYMTNLEEWRSVDYHVTWGITVLHCAFPHNLS